MTLTGKTAWSGISPAAAAPARKRRINECRSGQLLLHPAVAIRTGYRFSTDWRSTLFPVFHSDSSAFAAGQDRRQMMPDGA